MRTLAIALTAVLAGVSSAGAQTRGAPNLIITIYGGASSGHDLWNIARQQLPARGGAPPDTARLTRTLNSAIIAGLLASLFPSPHVGFNAEIGFRTFGFDDQCAPVVPFQNDPPLFRNQALCDNITASASSGSTLSVNLGATTRVAPHGALSPYVRAAVAFSYRAISSVAVIAAEPADTNIVAQRTIVADDNAGRFGVGGTLGAGLTVHAGVGYQFRLEVRDDISRIQRIVGPASPTGIAPTSTATFHHWGLLLGIDIVLEQKRTRRY